MRRCSSLSSRSMGSSWLAHVPEPRGAVGLVVVGEVAVVAAVEHEEFPPAGLVLRVDLVAESRPGRPCRELAFEGAAEPEELPRAGEADVLDAPITVRDFEDA